MAVAAHSVFRVFRVSPLTTASHGGNINRRVQLTCPARPSLEVSRVLPGRSVVALARRRRSGGGSASTARESSKEKKMFQVDHNEDNDTDEDALEALFSQLEEDLKNGNLSDDDRDDEITDEDLARLEQELAGALGDEDDDNEFFEMSNSNEDHVESNDEDDEEVRTPKLKNWQLRRLASALKIGRRKTSIKSLAAELGLDRALVLELLRNPPPNLLLMSASLPDKVVPTPLEPEKSTVSFPPTTLSEEPEISTIEPEVIKAPVHVMRGKWAMQKRLKKVQVEILEKVYARTKRPTRTMISSIVHVTNLPWKKVVKWFEDKRIEDGVPDKRFPYQRSVPETISTN